MKAGYKNTEVGVIPEDWEVKELGKLNPFITSGSRGWAKYYSTNGFIFIRITNMNRGSINLDLSDLRFVKLPENENEGKRTQLKNGDILISITADIGICSYIDDFLIKPAYINQHIALVRFENYNIDSQFVSYFLNSVNAQTHFISLTDSGAKAGMSLNRVSKINLAIPTRTEQTAIATALSDADAFISGLEQLIAKKRNIKQGAMQELLRAKEGWVVRKLGEVLKIRHGKDQKEVQSENGIYPILGTGGLMGATNEFLYNKPSVLIGRKGTIDKPQYMETPFWTVDTLFYTEILKENVAKFIYYIFNLIDWYSYNEASGVPSLNAKTIEKIEKGFPPYEEQKRIAAILSDMDAEIAALEAKLEKYRKVKLGMMQNLLTGKIRLV